MGLFKKLFGTRSEREIKKIQPMVDKILAFRKNTSCCLRKTCMAMRSCAVSQKASPGRRKAGSMRFCADCAGRGVPGNTRVLHLKVLPENITGSPVRGLRNLQCLQMSGAICGIPLQD